MSVTHLVSCLSHMEPLGLSDTVLEKPDKIDNSDRNDYTVFSVKNRKVLPSRVYNLSVMLTSFSNL